MGIKENIEVQSFITRYLEINHTASAVDERFHDEFYARFGGRRKETLWGAMPVAAAQLWLKKLHDQGIVTRCRVGLGCNWQPGFPKWVYVYSLSKGEKCHDERRVQG